MSIDQTPIDKAQANLEDGQIATLSAINQMSFASVDGTSAN